MKELGVLKLKPGWTEQYLSPPGCPHGLSKAAGHLCLKTECVLDGVLGGMPRMVFSAW